MTGKIIYRRFETFGDWLKECKANADPARTCPPSEGTILTRSARPWNGDVTYAEAIALAEHGWPEGRAMIQRLTAIAAQHTTPSSYTAKAYDVAGEYPDVPLFCAGDPMNMVTLGNQEHTTRPILRIMVEGWNSVYVKAGQMQRRGAAILALVDAIEQGGHRVELLIRFASDSTSQGYGIEGLCYDVMLKAADDALDMDRAAFALTHAASLRRFHFRQMECDSPIIAKSNRGCGMPAGNLVRNHRSDEFPNCIIFPSANEHNADYDAPDTAARRIESYLVDGLRSMQDMRCDGLLEAIKAARVH